MAERYLLRDYRPADAEAVNRVALAAFGAYRERYADWESLAPRLARAAELDGIGELIVACAAGTDEPVGLVAYLGVRPRGRSASGPAPAEWPVIRMLAVDPAHQGRGIGRALTEECVRRAEREEARVIALHTSPVMTVALPLYLRMGFELFHAIPARPGHDPAGLYVKRLDPPRGTT